MQVPRGVGFDGARAPTKRQGPPTLFEEFRVPRVDPDSICANHTKGRDLTRRNNSLARNFGIFDAFDLAEGLRAGFPVTQDGKKDTHVGTIGLNAPVEFLVREPK